METAVIMIMALVCFSFVLKLTYHNRIGRIVLSTLCALFILSTYDNASNQSKARISECLGQPELMLDISVWLTIDVAFQICFCILAAKALSSALNRTDKILLEVCLWIPGILIFFVLFAILTEVVLSMTGMDFATIGWTIAIAVLILFPLSTFIMRRLIPEKEIRLEMMFMINLIIAALGIITTVNGRVAATL